MWRQAAPLTLMLVLFAVIEWFAWEVSAGARARLRVALELALLLVFGVFVIAPLVANYPGVPPT